MSLLNVKAVTDLLSQNVDGKLCRYSWLMTVNGTLLAYSRPAGINHLRQQAAMVAIHWQEHQSQAASAHLAVGPDSGAEPPAEATTAPLSVLIVESESHNLIIESIQEHIILVIEGGIPTRRRASEVRMIAEDSCGKQRISLRSKAGDAEDISASSPTSDDSSAIRDDIAQTVLRIQRERLDGLADVIATEFKRTGFTLPRLANAAIF